MDIPRFFRFVKRYYRHPVFLITYLSTYFLKGFAFNVHFYTQEELLSLIRKGKSVIRLGDGDMVVTQLGMENAYHRDDARLRKMYKTIIGEYKENSPCILSVPRFINFTNRELDALGPGKLSWGVPMKVMFLLQFNKKAPYMDAHNFYYDNYMEGTIAPLFKDRKVIVVTRKETIDKQKNNPNIPWKDIVYIESPALHAMDKYEEVKENLDKALSGLSPKEVVIFFAMGPVGKCILYEYAHKGYQGIDIGKGVEVMFTGESIEYMI
jgi:hypothetical protein